MSEVSGSEPVPFEAGTSDTCGVGRVAFDAERADPALLFERYADDIYRYCRVRGCSPADAEDVTAEVFAQALPRLRTLRWRQRPVVAFLYTLANRRVTDVFRRAAREHAATREEEAAEPGRCGTQLGPAFARALRQLAEAEQLAVVLRVVHGYSFAEVAAVVGRGEKATKSLVYRGLERMQAALREEGIEP
jgi:RNA polymerase sigma-70 factor (ECF subfamily)